MNPVRRALAGWCTAALLMIAVPFIAQAEAMPPVTTRGEVRSVFEEDDGRRVYIRLRLAAMRHHPFSTLTYRVPDRAFIAGLREGMQVEFQAARMAGENRLTMIRPVAPGHPPSGGPGAN
jgi:Cu/Ag efflux protein CusF